MNVRIIDVRPKGRIVGDPPKPLSFRTERFSKGTIFPRNSQPWGEMHYSLAGVCEIEVDGSRYLSPPSYGIWIPPGVEHEAWAREDMLYATTYVTAELCDDLPRRVRTLAISRLMRSILADFADRGVGQPRSEEDLRLSLVLVDQIRLARQFASYLPSTVDPLLAPIIAALSADPGNRVSLAEWGQGLGVTERTLSRRWQSAVGMSFNDWRQRLKLVASISLLEGGASVKDVAAALGYNGPSAFIAMFRKMTGESPSRR